MIVRNAQIREDWKSKKWTVEELSYFWEIRPSLVESILKLPKRTFPAGSLSVGDVIEIEVEGEYVWPLDADQLLG